MKVKNQLGLALLALVMAAILAYPFGLLYQEVFGLTAISGSFIGDPVTWLSIVGLIFSVQFFSIFVYSIVGNWKGNIALIVLGLLPITFCFSGRLGSGVIMCLMLIFAGLILGLIMNKAYLNYKKNS